MTNALKEAIRRWIASEMDGSPKLEDVAGEHRERLELLATKIEEWGAEKGVDVDRYQWGAHWKEWGVSGYFAGVGEKYREFVPVRVKADVTNGGEEKKDATQSKVTVPEPAKGTVSVSSNPAGADVLVDGGFLGNAPAALKLSPAKHAVTVKMSGYKDRSNEITVQSGSDFAAYCESGKIAGYAWPQIRQIPLARAVRKSLRTGSRLSRFPSATIRCF